MWLHQAGISTGESDTSPEAKWSAASKISDITKNAQKDGNFGK